MPYHEILWTNRAIQKIEAHGLTREEVEYVVFSCRSQPLTSRESGLPAYKGRTHAGELIFVVFEPIDELRIAVITAYPIL
jgi:hypothetical protein